MWVWILFILIDESEFDFSYQVWIWLEFDPFMIWNVSADYIYVAEIDFISIIAYLNGYA